MTISIASDPDPIIPGKHTTIFYKNTDITQERHVTYHLTNSLGVSISDVYLGEEGSHTFTFENSILDSGLNILSIYDHHNVKIISFRIDISTVCFKENTKILCYLTNNQELYVPIENITDNMYIKTYKHGYKKVKYIMKSRIINTSERSINKLFKMSKSNNINLIEDLYITGSHAVLYDKIGKHKQEQMNNLVNKFDIDYNMKLDDKYKLIAYYDNNFEEYNENNYFNIYHLVLDSDRADINYGIYANGVLVESTDEITLARIKNVSLINSGFKPIDITTPKGLLISSAKTLGKIDNYIRSRNTHEVCVEDIIKKKEMLHNKKIEKEEKEKEMKIGKSTKSYTYKKNVHRKNCTYKK